jgi:hypothetical protein
MDARDFIDPDEGRDTFMGPIDWDSHLDPREAFYAEAEPCESCGRPCEERKVAKWDESLLVGPCCEFSLDFEFPELPNCYQLLKELDTCKSVFQVRNVFTAHARYCKECGGVELRRAA